MTVYAERNNWSIFIHQPPHCVHNTHNSHTHRHNIAFHFRFQLFAFRLLLLFFCCYIFVAQFNVCEHFVFIPFSIRPVYYNGICCVYYNTFLSFLCVNTYNWVTQISTKTMVLRTSVFVPSLSRQKRNPLIHTIYRFRTTLWHSLSLWSGYYKIFRIKGLVATSNWPYEGESLAWDPNEFTQTAPWKRIRISNKWKWSHISTLVSR